jgi:hypothetical protein
MYGELYSLSHGQTLTHNVHDHGHDGPLWLNENILFNMSQINIQYPNQ